MGSKNAIRCSTTGAASARTGSDRDPQPTSSISPPQQPNNKIGRDMVEGPEDSSIRKQEPRKELSESSSTCFPAFLRGPSVALLHFTSMIYLTAVPSFGSAFVLTSSFMTPSYLMVNSVCSTVSAVTGKIVISVPESSAP